MKRRWMGVAAIMAAPPYAFAGGDSGLMAGLLLSLCGLALCRVRPAAAGHADLEDTLARLAFKICPDEITLVVGGEYVHANPAALRNMGLASMAELRAKGPGRTAPEFQPDGRRSTEIVKTMIPQALRTGTARFSWVRMRANGEHYPVDATLTAVSVGGQQQLIGYYRDVSELQQTRAQQQATLQRLAGGLQLSIQGVAQQVRHSASELTEDAQALSAFSIETSGRLGDSADTAAAVVAQLVAVAGSTDQLADTVRSIMRQVSETQAIVGRAAAEADTGVAMADMLSNTAQSIGMIVQIIARLSANTNLLALNAAIEAARAGAAGAGFAVVAGEVKALAGQTARAAEQIQTQIAAMQHAIAQMVGAIRQMAATMQGVRGTSVSIEASMREQGAATHLIAESVQQVTLRTKAMSNTISAAADATTQTQGLTAQVVERAVRLAGKSDTLHTEMAGFRDAIRLA